MLQLSAVEEALLEVGHWLREQGYVFTTIAPQTHRRVVNREMNAPARTARDVFGWSRPFERTLLPPSIVRALERGEVVSPRGAFLEATIRFSTLGNGLYLHSSFPTTSKDSVFFGPDTYRFCRFLAANVGNASLVVDVGAGSGAGALSLAASVERIILADINPRAQSYSRVNAHLAGVADRVEVVGGDLYSNVRGHPDLVVANPPYLVDVDKRTYRDGGASLGTELGLQMVTQGIARLRRNGRVMLYTGAPIVNGDDPVREALREIALGARAQLSYEEIDPDVFGEELDTPAYRSVERIAAVGAVIALGS